MRYACSGPLPEDLFSGLEELSVGVAGSSHTINSAPADLDHPSPMPISHTSQVPTSPPALHRQVCHDAPETATGGRQSEHAVTRATGRFH